MKSKMVSSALFTLVLLFATAANSQQPMERRPMPPIDEGAVSEKSPAVRLNEVSKEVAPGVFVVDPASIRGKRLVLPPSGGTARHICIGKWDGVTKTCKGIYIEW